MPRPTKLTPKIQDDICKLLSAGNYIEPTCAYVGISHQTYYDWMAQGRKAKSGKYLEFLEAVEKARASAEMRNVQNIQKASEDGTWQASAWFLERSYKDRWGRKDKVEVTHKYADIIQALHDGKITADDVREITPTYANEILKHARISA